jgi:pimeloyl-ACP methyl ester carboxylesterase
MTVVASGQKRRLRDVVQYGVEVDVIVDGHGPPVVMLPSSGRDSEDFDEVASGIAAAGYRVLRPQPRGIGRSVGPMHGITYHDFARDVAAAIKTEDTGRAVVVGHAFGNWIARMTAADHPRLVRGIVLAAAAAKTFPPALGEAVAKCADLSLPDAERLKALQYAFFAPGHDPSVWLKGWHPSTMKSQGLAGQSTIRDDWWPGGTAPILDLQASLDPFRPRSTVNELKDEFGDRVSIKVIEDASHALIPEQPTAVVAEIVKWIETLQA